MKISRKTLDEIEHIHSYLDVDVKNIKKQLVVASIFNDHKAGDSAAKALRKYIQKARRRIMHMDNITITVEEITHNIQNRVTKNT